MVSSWSCSCPCILAPLLICISSWSCYICIGYKFACICSSSASSSCPYFVNSQYPEATMAIAMYSELFKKMSCSAETYWLQTEHLFEAGMEKGVMVFMTTPEHQKRGNAVIGRFLSSTMSLHRVLLAAPKDVFSAVWTIYFPVYCGIPTCTPSSGLYTLMWSPPRVGRVYPGYFHNRRQVSRDRYWLLYFQLGRRATAGPASVWTRRLTMAVSMLLTGIGKLPRSTLPRSTIGVHCVTSPSRPSGIEGDTCSSRVLGALRPAYEFARPRL